MSPPCGRHAARVDPMGRSARSGLRAPRVDFSRERVQETRFMSEKRDLYEIGEIPPVGHVPKQMYAQLIRAERFGEPKKAFQVEKVPVPEIAPDEVLVYVMAAGINYNNVWAALGSRSTSSRCTRRRRRHDRASTSAAATPPASSTPSAATSRTSRSATRSSSTAAPGTANDPVVKAGDRPDVRADASRSGATRPTGAASRSSRRCRRTSACRSRST